VTITDYTSGSPVTIASGNADQLYCDSFSSPVTFTTSGNHLIRVSFSGDSNVNGSTSTGYLTVNTNTYSYVSLSADNASVIAGSPFTLVAQIGSDVRQYAATGTVTFLDGQSMLGSAKLDPTGTATLLVKTLAAGTHNITANYSGDAVLQASSGGPWVETVADYVLQAQPSAISIPAGLTGSTTINVLPLGGSTQAVQLSCGTLPVDVSCSFSPAVVTLDGVNPAAEKVTVSTQRTTVAATLGGEALGVASTLAFTAILLPLGLRRRWKKALGFVAVILVVLYGVACGGSSSSNSAKQGVYAITISGASAGSQVKTTSLVVTVTR